jgi:hypothetical protein
MLSLLGVLEILVFGPFSIDLYLRLLNNVHIYSGSDRSDLTMCPRGATTLHERLRFQVCPIDRRHLCVEKSRRRKVENNRRQDPEI